MMETNGWGLSLCLKDKTGKPMCVMPGEYFESNQDLDTFAYIPVFYRTKAKAMLAAKNQETESVRYKVSRYRIRWDSI